MSQDLFPDLFPTCAVVGVGLIGGSLGMALRASGRRVVGFDLLPQTLAQAQIQGAIDRGVSDVSELLEADLTILAVPPARMGEVARKIVPFLKPGSVLTDVASVKAAVVAEVESAALGNGVHYVGSHPMFGTEEQGVVAARADLMRGAAWIFTPTARTDALALAALERLASQLGLRPIRLLPEEHDQKLAALSHVPYLVAVALTRLGQSFAEVAGPAFREMSRVAGSPVDVWREILTLNRVYAQEAVDRLCAELQRLARLEGDALKAALEEARIRRKSMGGIPLTFKDT